MNSYHPLFNRIRLFTLLGVLVASGCSNSNNSNSPAPSENDTGNGTLVLCTDTDSCASNPTLEIGNERPAQVHIPSDYTTTTRYPLVIVLHGFGATGLVQSLYFGLPVRVDSKQFVLVVPDGTENSNGRRFWNATSACCAGTPEEFEIDDVEYIRSLIEEAAATYSIDPGRIGLIGHSNGGFMSLRMACEASDLVTSVVSLAGSTFEDAASCSPATKPVSVLALHGDEDETIPYDGNPRGPYPGALETIDRFSVLAGCDSNNPVMSENIDVVTNIEGTETTVLHYNNCAKGVDVELWSLVGGPHIPGPYTASALDGLVDWLIDHRRDD